MSLFSVNTNLGAMTALQSLEQTQNALTTTQNQISTGLAVATAADNPAVYSITQAMDGQIAGLTAVQDNLSFGAQVVGTAMNSTESISSVLSTLQQTLTQGQTQGMSQTQMNASLTAGLQQIELLRQRCQPERREPDRRGHRQRRDQHAAQRADQHAGRFLCGGRYGRAGAERYLRGAGHCRAVGHLHGYAGRPRRQLGDGRQGPDADRQRGGPAGRRRSGGVQHELRGTDEQLRDRRDGAKRRGADHCGAQ